jgi:hypothetical protein
MKQAYDMLHGLVEDAVLEKTRADGPFVLGDTKYYAGKEKETVQTAGDFDMYRTLMQVTGGDLAVVLSCLRSKPWKHGEIRKLLLEKLPKGADAEIAFNNLFKIEEVPVLKKGKPSGKDAVGLQKISVAVLKRIGAQ